MLILIYSKCSFIRVKSDTQKYLLKNLSPIFPLSSPISITFILFYWLREILKKKQFTLVFYFITKTLEKKNK